MQQGHFLRLAKILHMFRKIYFNVYFECTFYLLRFFQFLSNNNTDASFIWSITSSYRLILLVAIDIAELSNRVERVETRCGYIYMYMFFFLT